MGCDECARGEHGTARVRASGVVVCECCNVTLAPFIMSDDRPRDMRLSLVEAAREGHLNKYPAFNAKGE